MGVALRYEERRCNFISEQTRSMVMIHDDSDSTNPTGALVTILEKCGLAKNIKNLYDDLCSTGTQANC